LVRQCRSEAMITRRACWKPSKSRGCPF